MVIEVTENPFYFSLEQLFSVGKRVNNKKRNFLFISKLLGKHLEVYPDICKASGRFLAALKYPELMSEDLIEFIKNPSKNFKIKKLLEQSICVKSKVLILGFAETATGLGMSVAASIKDSTYYTTSREEIIDIPCLFSFQEEHSHSSTHRFYDGIGTNFNKFEEIVLVDDEITTGKSMLNLIEKLSEISNIKKYTILTVLDWRNEENRNLYEHVMKEKRLDIQVHSIISGSVYSDDATIYEDQCKELKSSKNVYMCQMNEREEHKQKDGTLRSYYKNTGRFGTTWESIQRLEESANDAAKKIMDQILKKKDKKILILGEGEDIYYPSRIASHLEKFGFDVKFKTTTRSPIYCDGFIIKEKESYKENEITLYLYNRNEIENNYDRIIFIPEIKRKESICENFTTILV